MISQKHFLKFFFPICAVLIFGFLAIARLLWPATSPPYDDAWETISGLGDMVDNPQGFWFFQFSMVVVGILILPALLYCHPRLAKVKKGLARFGSFWFFMGAVGFLLTGLIPNGVVPIDKFHEICAGVGSVGVVFAAGLYGLVIIKGKVPVNRKLFIFISLMWWATIILLAFSFGYGELVIEPPLDLGWYGPDWGAAGVSVFYSFALWERVIFVVIVVYAGLIVILVPERET